MSDKTRPTILLEDDATLRGLMVEGLKQAGHTVIEAPTAELAEAALVAAEGRAILVADRSIEAGGRNGFQVASEALEHYPSLKVVYVTGTHIAIRRRTLGERERALLKPFAMTQLLGALRDLSR